MNSQNLNEKISQLKENIVKFLNRKDKKIKKKIKNIEDDIKRFMDFEKFTTYGEILKYNLHKIKRGKKSFTGIDYRTGKSALIPLDPKKDVETNMNIYFKRAKKQKKGLGIAKERLQKANEEQKEIKSEREIVSETNDIDLLEKILKKYEPKKAKPQDLKRAKKRIGKVYLYNDHLFFVGRNDKENEQLVKFVGGGNDWWFHIRDYPGSHVICIAGKKGEIDFELIKFGATLALINSKAGKSDEEEVIYTQKKYVKLASRGKTGQVVCANERTIRIKRDIDTSQFKIKGNEKIF